MTVAGRLWPLVAAASLLALGRGSPLPQGTSSDGSSVALGDACTGAADCSDIVNAECDGTLKKCKCLKDFPVGNTNACLSVVGVDGNCTVTAQCRPEVTGSVCSQEGVCSCRSKHYKHEYSDGTKLCLLREGGEKAKSTPVDPVMIGILVSLVLMFLIICVVLQLFSKARFRQNRTILNSANPRLMNTSFLKESVGKRGSAGGARGARGSHGSIETAGAGSVTGDDTTQLESKSTDSGLQDEPAAAGVARLPNIKLPPLKSKALSSPDSRSRKENKVD